MRHKHVLLVIQDLEAHNEVLREVALLDYGVPLARRPPITQPLLLPVPVQEVVLLLVVVDLHISQRRYLEEDIEGEEEAD